MSPAISTVYENQNFVPTTGTPYQRTALLEAQPENEVLGTSYYRLVGLFQVILCYPQNKGAGDARARAELVKTHFARGTRLTESGQNILVIRTPQISPAFLDGDRYCLPISIFYRSEIF